MFIKKHILTGLTFLGLLQAETSVALNINNSDIEIIGEFNFNTESYTAGTSYAFNAGYLYIDEDTHLATIGISGKNALQGVNGLYLEFGFKAAIADDFVAIPLTVKAIYDLPLIESMPTTSLVTSFAYAPSVLSFSDAEKYSEFRVGVSMEAISNIHIFAGYRNVDTNYKTHDKSFNSSFYGGLKLSF